MLNSQTHLEKIRNTTSNIKKKVGVAGLQPTLYLHDYSKLSN